MSVSSVWHGYVWSKHYFINAHNSVRDIRIVSRDYLVQQSFISDKFANTTVIFYTYLNYDTSAMTWQLLILKNWKGWHFWVNNRPGWNVTIFTYSDYWWLILSIFSVSMTSKICAGRNSSLYRSRRSKYFGAHWKGKDGSLLIGRSINSTWSLLTETCTRCLWFPLSNIWLLFCSYKPQLIYIYYITGRHISHFAQLRSTGNKNKSKTTFSYKNKNKTKQKRNKTKQNKTKQNKTNKQKNTC